jgi:hypothetical protein
MTGKKGKQQKEKNKVLPEQSFVHNGIVRFG